MNNIPKAVSVLRAVISLLDVTPQCDDLHNHVVLCFCYIWVLLDIRIVLVEAPQWWESN